MKKGYNQFMKYLEHINTLTARSQCEFAITFGIFVDSHSPIDVKLGIHCSDFYERRSLAMSKSDYGH